MGLMKRGNVWWFSMTLNGVRVRESTNTGNEDEAKAYAKKREDEILQKHHGVSGKTIGNAIDLWIGLNTQKKDYRNDVAKGNFFKERCGDWDVTQMTRSRLLELISDRPSESTKNRYTSFISAVLVEAMDNEWMEQVPKFKYFKEPRREVEMPKHWEFKLLWSALPFPHAQAAQFALATGLRQANVYDLTWDQVFLNERYLVINGSSMKNGKSLRVPLNDEAYHCLMDCQSLHAVYCFGGKLVNHRTWKNALKRADLPSTTRWHDLRHFWASNLAKEGVPLLKIKALGGWSSITLLDRYAHLSPMDCGQ
jgi:integrase